MKDKKKIISLVALVVLVIVILFVWFLYLSKASIFKKPVRATKEPMGAEVMVRCVSDRDSKVEKNPKYKTEIVIGKTDSNKNYSGEKSNNNTLSLLSYGDSLVNLNEDLFFTIKKDNGKTIEGVAGKIELCNNENMTRPQEVKDLASKNAIEKTYSVHDGIVPKEAGEYRVDAYVYDSDTKKWQLTDRIDRIVFEK